MWYALCVIIGLVVGVTIAWLFASIKIGKKFREELDEFQHKASNADGQISILQETLGKSQSQVESLNARLDTESQARVKAETQLEDTITRLKEEKLLLEEAKIKLSDTFKALAGDTLNSSNQAFLKLAKETFENIIGEAKGDLGKRQEAIDGLIKPLSESLKQFEEHVRGLENSRQAAYTGLETHLKSLVTTQQQLQKETGNLVTALRTPQVRGRWGELTLKRVAELAGMSEHCDFTEQVTTQTEEGRIRPDLIVHLHAEREIIVDSKVPLESYLNALSADSEEKRQSYLESHARQVRNHMNTLSSRSYWKQFQKAPEYVVMFIPGESFFGAAVDHDHALLEDGMEKRVILATPTTLIALLLAIAYGWQQEKVAQNAIEISELGKQLYDRMRVMSGHVSDIGKGLGNAVESYNKAVGSIEARVLPAARRFKDLRAATGDNISLIGPVEANPRVLNIPELFEEAEEVIE